MKKLIALLCAVCAAAMSLCVACASPLTGDTSNMGLDHPGGRGRHRRCGAAHRGQKEEKINSVQTAPAQWPGAVFMLLALAIDLNLAACGE